MNKSSNSVLKLMTLMFLSSLLFSCAERLYPIEVSEKFWRAVKDKEIATIQKYSTSAQLSEEEFTENILPLDEITLGKTVIDGDSAWVDTTVTVAADKPLTFPLKTMLVKEKDQWKVDYDATMSLISRESAIANMINGIKNLGEELKAELTEGLDESIKDIQEVLPEVEAEVKEEVEKIEESLLEHIPELKTQIESLIEELKEAFKDIGKPTEEAQTTEI